MPVTPRDLHELDIDPHSVDRHARRRAKHSNPFREAHSGEGCRTLFPELLLAGVSDDGLANLGKRTAARADQAPTIAVWLHGVIAKELSRRTEMPLRGLPVVAMPLIPNAEIGPTAQVLREMFLQFDSWSRDSAPGAAEVADLLAALSSLASAKPA
jgi:hypothetical protein